MQVGLGTAGPFGPSLVPAIGFGITDSWLLEAAVFYWRTSYDTGDGFLFSTSEFGIAPGLAHVFAVGQSVRPFVGLRAELGRVQISQSNADSDGSKSGRWTFEGSARAGVQFHVAEHLSFDPYGALRYAHTSREETGLEWNRCLGRQLGASLRRKHARS